MTLEGFKVADVILDVGQTWQKFTVNVWKKSCRILILNSLGKVDILKFMWKLKILAKSVSRLNLKGTGSLRSENSLF